MPRLRILRAEGDADDAEVSLCREGVCVRGGRLLAVVDSSGRRFFALVVQSGSSHVVAVHGDAGAGSDDESVFSLVLRNPDGSEWLLSEGARVLAVFSESPVSVERARAAAIAEVAPEGLEVEAVTLSFVG